MFKKIKELFIAPNIDEKFQVPISTKIKLSFGNFGFNLSAGLVAAYLMYFYIRILKINPLLWGLAWILYFAWNSINDPLVGYLSDRTRTRFGRRVPWLMLSVPMLTFGLILMFFPPATLLGDPSNEATQWALFFWLFITLMIYDTAFTIFGLCSGALISELSIEPDERARMSLFGLTGGGLAMVITFIVPFMFLVNEEPHEQNLPIIQNLVLIFAIIGAICVAIMAFGIKERKEFCYAEAKMETMKFWESIKYTIKNKGFLIYIGFAFMIGYIQIAMYSQIIFYIQDVLEIKGSDLFNSIPLMAFVLGILMGVPLSMLFNEKYGSKRGLIYLSFIAITGLIMIVFASEVIMASISLFIMGMGYLSMTVLIPILICDVVDKDELDTGYRREGAYFGSAALFTKPAQSVAAFITALVLVLTDYDSNSATQSELAKLGIKINLGLIPALFLLVGIIILWFFPLDGSTQEYKDWKKQIEILHDQKLENLRKACGEENKSRSIRS
ncbi:MAG: MFS transporter [Promethearchaeota archaeon]